MSISEAQASPANALVFVQCKSGGELPTELSDGLVTATSSCIAIGTQASIDGPTHLRIADQEDRISFDDGLQSVWRQQLPVPSGVLVITDVYGEPLLEREVGKAIELEIWANHATEPDELSIVIMSNEKIQ